MIDYKEEVKKIYPNATTQWIVTEGQLCGWVIKDSRSMFSKTISNGLHSQQQAWQSAYEQITNPTIINATKGNL